MGATGMGGGGDSVTDEDLQAQAWLPSCLTALLAEVSLSDLRILWPKVFTHTYLIEG